MDEREKERRDEGVRERERMTNLSKRSKLVLSPTHPVSKEWEKRFALKFDGMRAPHKMNQLYVRFEVLFFL